MYCYKIIKKRGRKGMENPRIKKGLGVTVVLLFLSTTCLPIVNASEEKPDLIIEDIFLWPSSFPNEYHFEYSVKNIGDTATPYYWSAVEISVKIYWLALGTIPLLRITSYTHTDYLDTIRPGETINLSFASCDRLPKFGSYRFSLKVNPNLKIEESDYDNNKYSEDWKVFLGQWKEIG
jgi:hypothetical protein